MYNERQKEMIKYLSEVKFARAEQLSERFQVSLETVRRDYSHPSIVGWCPLNETQGDQDPQLVNMLYEMTKAVDSTRPFIDASGWTHVRSCLLYTSRCV